MELKDFVKKVIIELDQAVSEASIETAREVRFKGVKEKRNALEFDIAVAVDSSVSDKGGAGIKVLEFIQLGGESALTKSSSTVSRITFGVGISNLTKKEISDLEGDSDLALYS